MKFKSKNHQSSWNHKVAPRESAWMRLETKLDNHRKERSISQYKYMSLAAVMVAIVGVMSVFFVNKSSIVPTLNNEHAYNVDMIEQLDTKEAGIYEVSKLQSLKHAYNKYGGKG